MVKRTFIVGCAFLAGMASLCHAGGREETDSRIRTYVYPYRVVWQSPVSAFDFDRSHWSVEGAESLLERKRGQIPENGLWNAPNCRLKNSGVAPGILLDFGREMFGSVQLGCSCGSSQTGRVRLRFGESVGEAMSELGDRGSTNAHGIRDGYFDVPSTGTITIGDTGFRFLRIDLVSNGTLTLDFVRAVSLTRSMKRLGSFRCSDNRLNAIWDTAVTTVHLCCQDRLWDGIKRDRIVWAGDMHPEAVALLNVFGRVDILPESLDYLMEVTDPKTSWMNRVVTYSMWFIRDFAAWYWYTGDVEYVRRHAEYLVATLNRLIGNIDEDGVFQTDDRIILDWPTEHNGQAKQSGVQGLLAMTLDDGVILMEAVGNTQAAETCRRAAHRVRSQKELLTNGSKQAAALLTLSGMAAPNRMFADVLSRNGHKGVSTFYGYYMLEAMSAAGEHQRALDTIRDYWGAMLDVGATSFWENFEIAWTNGCIRLDAMPQSGKKDIHGDFGEFCYPGFRHSLCHGWSCGPASWLINHVLGIRPIAPGCAKVEVCPKLGSLSWAEGAMALPDGHAVRVRVERGGDGGVKFDIKAPSWVTIEGPRGDEGPLRR